MISVVQAQELIKQQVKPLAAESVSLADVHGRILQEAVESKEDMPPFDRSAMDGYAVRADDGSDSFAVVGEIRAGQVGDHKIERGRAVRVFTGARMPGPGLKVVLQEHVEMRDQKIHLLKKSPASHVRLRGEDARAGETLLAPGITLDAAAVGVLASVGATVVHVAKKPAILHLTTGDEIVPPEQTPGPGQIRNSNASLVAGLCREQGIETLRHVHAPDDLPSLVNTLTLAEAATYDLILISGGSGHGDYDLSAQLFEHLGATIHFREVNVRPGKPLIFGTGPSQVIFGLPGNVLSHFVCFHLFVRQALDGLMSRVASTTIQGYLTHAMTDTGNARETWWPAQARLNQGRLECQALPWKSSGDITRLPSANSLIRVPASTPQIAAETLVELHLTRNPF